MRVTAWLAMVFALLAGSVALASTPPTTVIPSDMQAIDTLPANLRHAIITLQAQGSEWGLAWNLTDSANCDMALFTEMPDGRYVDPTFPLPGKLVLRSMRDGISVDSQPIEVGGVDSHSKVTLKIVYDNYAARLYAGGNELRLVGEIPFTDEAQMVAFVNRGKATMTRGDALFFSHPAIEPSFWPDADSLIDYVASSTDPLEGLWEHLDRDITLPVTLGGKYTLATVKAADRYHIIYVAGDASPYQLFKPLDIKGAITPTIFNDNYDLMWQCADGRVLNDDTYATLSDDHAILTLHFPVEKSTLRLRRIPGAQTLAHKSVK